MNKGGIRKSIFVSQIILNDNRRDHLLGRSVKRWLKGKATFGLAGFRWLDCERWLGTNFSRELTGSPRKELNYTPCRWCFEPRVGQRDRTCRNVCYYPSARQSHTVDWFNDMRNPGRTSHLIGHEYQWCFHRREQRLIRSTLPKMIHFGYCPVELCSCCSYFRGRIVFMLAGPTIIGAMMLQTQKNQIRFPSVRRILVHMRYLADLLFQIAFQMEAERAAPRAVYEDRTFDIGGCSISQVA